MKKILTMFLSLLMVATLGVVNVSADDENVAKDNNGKEYSTLQSAINTEDVTEVELLTDVDESVTVGSGKTISLKLAGHTLKGTNGDTIYVQKGATLTVNGQGGKVVATKGSYAAVFNNGTTYLIDGGQYVRDDSSKWYIIVNHGTMEINGSKIESTNASDTSSAIENGYSSYSSGNERRGYIENTNEANPALTIYSANVSTYGYNAVKNDDGGILTVKDGEFKTINRSDGAVVQNWNIATINGGTFIAQNSLSVVSNGASDGVKVNTGQLTINGGTFVQDGNYPDGVVFAYGQGASTPEYGTAKVYGGTFTGKTLNSISYKLEISGGTFSNDVTKYLAKGYNAVKDKNGVYQIVSEEKETIVDVDQNKTATPALEESAYNTAKTAVEELNKKITEADKKITFDTSTKVELNAEEITGTTTNQYTKEDETKVIAEAKKVITDTANKEIKTLPLDITLNVVNGESKTPITDLSEEITVTLYLNDKTLSAIKDNNPTVIRIHDDKYEYLPTTLKGNALSFDTNKFSTYVIAYTETKATPTKYYDPKDKNQDGIITCDEEMNSANWVWSTSKNACVYKVSNTSVR